MCRSFVARSNADDDRMTTTCVVIERPASSTCDDFSDNEHLITEPADNHHPQPSDAAELTC